MNVLPDNGLLAGTSTIQLCRCQPLLQPPGVPSYNRRIAQTCDAYGHNQKGGRAIPLSR
jgi:hypothetical protein